MLKSINKAWGWQGIKAKNIVQINKFGNVIFRTANDQFWRICPEALECIKIANSTEQYNRLIKDQDFLSDWFIEDTVEIAQERYGIQRDDRCFCLKIPDILGGPYDIENIGTISRKELILFSGDIAEQIKDVPDGGKIEFKFV